MRTNSTVKPCSCQSDTIKSCISVALRRPAPRAVHQATTIPVVNQRSCQRHTLFLPARKCGRHSRARFSSPTAASARRAASRTDLEGPAQRYQSPISTVADGILKHHSRVFLNLSQRCGTRNTSPAVGISRPASRRSKVLFHHRCGPPPPQTDLPEYVNPVVQDDIFCVMFAYCIEQQWCPWFRRAVFIPWPPSNDKPGSAQPEAL